MAHVEAGMRSFDRSMPEELNRVLVDHASSLLLCSTEVAMTNLRHEAVTAPTELVGDVMVDVAMAVAARGHGSGWTWWPGTASSPASTCSPPRTEPATSMSPIACSGWWTCCARCPLPVVLPLHPRTAARLREFALLEQLQSAPQVRLVPPLGYVELTALLCNARAVLTDSGGLQKEAYLAGRPLHHPAPQHRVDRDGRDTAGTCSSISIVTARWRRWSASRRRSVPTLYGDGHAGERVVAALDTAATPMTRCRYCWRAGTR